jgi:hypothetical protein
LAYETRVNAYGNIAINTGHFRCGCSKNARESEEMTVFFSKSAVRLAGYHGINAENRAALCKG